MLLHFPSNCLILLARFVARSAADVTGAQDRHLPLAPDGAAAAFGIIVEQAADCCIVKVGWPTRQRLWSACSELRDSVLAVSLTCTDATLLHGCHAGALQGQATTAAGHGGGCS